MAAFLEPGRATRPSVTENVIKTLLSNNYGLRMLSYKELNSYDDWNFWVETESAGTNKTFQEICNHGYVLKILNSLDSKNTQVIDAQHEMMFRVYEGGIPTPRAVPTLTGQLYLMKDLPSEDSKDPEQEDSHVTYIVRLFNYIPGSTLNSVPLTEDLCYKVGVMAGRLDKVLKGFHHSGFHGYHRKWHLDCLPRLSDVLHVIQDDSDKGMVADILNTFKSRVLNHLDDLPNGVIHGDLNDQNIVVSRQTHPNCWNEEYEIAAILDYGDSVVAPYIFEVAIAMAYMSILCDQMSLQTTSGYVLAGYLIMMNLSDQELDHLQFCMCARMVQSLVIGAYSYHMNPSEDYTLSTAAKEWPRLRQLWNTDRDDLVKEWKSIADKSTYK